MSSTTYQTYDDHTHCHYQHANGHRLHGRDYPQQQLELRHIFPPSTANYCLRPHRAQAWLSGDDVVSTWPLWKRHRCPFSQQIQFDEIMKNSSRVAIPKGEGEPARAYWDWRLWVCAKQHCAPAQTATGDPIVGRRRGSHPGGQAGRCGSAHSQPRVHCTHEDRRRSPDPIWPPLALPLQPRPSPVRTRLFRLAIAMVEMNAVQGRTRRRRHAPWEYLG